MPTSAFLFRSCLLLVAVFLVASCAKQVPLPGEPSPLGTPTLEDKARFHHFNTSGSVHQSLLIDLKSQGLVSWMELQPPLEYSLEYARKRPQKQRAATKGNVLLTWGQIVHSLESMLELLPRLDRRPELLAKYFTWFELSPTPIMSGYYTPEIEGSLTKKPGYNYPIYAKPRDLKTRRGSALGPKAYRVKKGKTLPYYSRRDIDLNGVLKSKGLEIAWFKDPLDAFNLHVEGAGRVRLPDGTIRTLVFAAKNDRSFKGMGAILRDKGLLPPGKLTLPYIRIFCQRNPELAKKLMLENESYIFFKFGSTGAEATIGRPLTPMVSLATDPRLLPLGSMVVMNTDIPAEGGLGQRVVRGLGLAQDTGTAIKGARLDYYVGEGHRAEAVGCRIWNKARIYLLVSREVMGNERAEY